MVTHISQNTFTDMVIMQPDRQTKQPLVSPKAQESTSGNWSPPKYTGLPPAIRVLCGTHTTSGHWDPTRHRYPPSIPTFPTMTNVLMYFI